MKKEEEGSAVVGCLAVLISIVLPILIMAWIGAVTYKIGLKPSDLVPAKDNEKWKHENPSLEVRIQKLEAQIKALKERPQ